MNKILFQKVHVVIDEQVSVNILDIESCYVPQ